MEYLFTYQNVKIYVIKSATAPAILDDVDQIQVYLSFTLGKGQKKYNKLDDLINELSIKE